MVCAAWSKTWTRMAESKISQRFQCPTSDTWSVPISAKLFKTSTFRLAAVYLLVFAISVAAILGYVSWNTSVLLERQIDDSIEAEIASLADQYRQGGMTGVLEAVNRRGAGN